MSPRVLLLLPVLAVPLACDDGPGEPAGAATYVDTLTFLAEEGDGRDNLSDGSRLVQDRLVDELAAIAQPVAGGDGYRHPFDEGTNLLGFIEGTTAPAEVVVIGAHYDHLGHDCQTNDPADDVCDGAGDNAAGVAAVLEIGRRLAADPPARSVLIALWDAEEDTRLGSIAAVQSGAIDIDAVVAYLNWDMQGIDLLPSLADTTFVIGAESGGAALEQAVAAGIESSDLQPLDLSVLFGQGRSDHASFLEAGVPAVFFSDATSACYHTAQDDMAHLDIGKLARQIDLGEHVTRAVADAATVPTLVVDAPRATYADAVAVQTFVERFQPDLERFPAADRAVVEQFSTDLDAIVDDGAAAFDDDDADVLLDGTAVLMERFTMGECT